jgi:putative endonuclease
MSDKREIGTLGEDAANKYLTDNGYKILQRNFRTRFGEIDIVAREGRYLVFVEVKTRKSLGFGFPRESVDGYKQSRIKNVANLYIAKKRLFDIYLRFDVVEVIVDGRNELKLVVLIKDVFE